MIVSCPSCQTRYRHAASAGAAPRRARCSRCEEEFPLSPLRPSYVVLQAGAGGGMSIGMDDPSLASRLRETGLDAAGAAAKPLTYGVVAREDAAASAAAAPRKAPPSVGDEKPRRRSAGRETMGAMLLAALGAAAAYHGSTVLDGDPVVWTGGGAGVGLLLGWAWIRWAERKR